MCGIVAATSYRNVVPVLLEGLRRLEYRGYDSCGIGIVDSNGLDRFRSVSRVSDLSRLIDKEKIVAQTGIAHTRWATHGAPEVCNAHPHFSCGKIGIVHNGIIENFEYIKEILKKKGYSFSSQTDTEIIVHLINDCFTGDLLNAVQRAVVQLKGSYAIAVISHNNPNLVILARKGSPLVVGVGKQEMFAASDAMALAGVTNKIIYLEEGDVCELKPSGYRIYARDNENFVYTVRKEKILDVYSNSIELGSYSHYMQKEIFEQPKAISDTLGSLKNITPELFGYKADLIFKNAKRLLFIACGTSYYAGLAGKYWIESIAGIPCDVEIASEYRYRNPVPEKNTLVIPISQSGETADTLAAFYHARNDLGLRNSLAICNVETSLLVKEAELHYITRAGVEIGVASTKAFTTQLLTLYILALTLAKVKGQLSSAVEFQALRRLRHLPTALQGVLALEPSVITWAEHFRTKKHVLFLGRGIHYPIALEGALKLKEISYIHAEAYPAGELKHGPLALVDSDMPVVTIAPNDCLFDKLKSNMQEVRARGGELFVLADASSPIEADDWTHVIRLPEDYDDLSPIVHVVLLQLLAYHTAVLGGRDVDKPRNLAKSVTVE